MSELLIAIPVTNRNEKRRPLEFRTCAANMARVAGHLVRLRSYAFMRSNRAHMAITAVMEDQEFNLAVIRCESNRFLTLLPQETGACYLKHDNLLKEL